MRHLTFRIRVFLLAWAFLAAGGVFLAQSRGGGSSGSAGRPGRTPESGLLPGGGPTTKAGSHESSAKDERDRVAGKFPAPKEKGGDEGGRGGSASSTVYVDVVAVEARHQALTLTSEDLRVSIDGVSRPIVAMHYVFRGPEALTAGRAIPVGRGVIARGDEERTIVVAVDEASVRPPGSNDAIAAIEHVLAVVAPSDRAAVVPVSQPASVAFAENREQLVESVAQLSSRARASGPAPRSFQALATLLNGLVKIEGPKQVIFFSAGHGRDTRSVTDTPVPADDMSALVRAAAASRSTVHVVLPSMGVADTDLHEAARATGGTFTHLSGEAGELDALATALLGGYVIGISAVDSDRNGKPHTLAVTTTRRGVRLFAASQWIPRADPLPQLIPQPVKAGTR